MIHEALCDSFNTPLVMLTIREIILMTNTYLSNTKSKTTLESKSNKYNIPSIHIIDLVTTYISHLFTMFGIESQFSSQNASYKSEGESLLKVVETLSLFRDKVRKLAQAGENGQAILEECDRLRDVELVELGIVLDDQPGT